MMNMSTRLMPVFALAAVALNGCVNGGPKLEVMPSR
jgi:hypothetical protein